MLHLLYILAFTILSLIAVANLIRNLVILSTDQDRRYPPGRSISSRGSFSYFSAQSAPHPELLDISGNLIKDPLLVMRSISVEDARTQLDALYESSPGYKGEAKDEG